MLATADYVSRFKYHGKLSPGFQSGSPAAPNEPPKRRAKRVRLSTGGNSMSVVKRVRLKGTRQVGLMLAGLLVAGLAAVSGTALASSGSVSSTAAMTGMAQTMSASMHGQTGFTNGWYDGHTVRFFYSKNYFCQSRRPAGRRRSARRERTTPRPRRATSTRCTWWSRSGSPRRSATLQCPVAGHCIDHPGTIDLSAVLGSGTSNLALPAHSHIVATRQQRSVRVVERGRRRRQEPRAPGTRSSAPRATRSCSTCSATTPVR